ncbi:MAG: lytic transglycosylase domain-containing protein [Gemmatimonadales bacterium]|jgi:soluble lytic murein transglycosylase-like protein
MILIRNVLGHVLSELGASWRRLSATQRLTLHGAGLLGVLVLLGAFVGSWAPKAAASSDEGYTGTAVQSQFRFLRQSLDTTAGELELARLELARAAAVLRYSADYQIPADLAALTYDAALREGIDPELAFRIIELESAFDPQARSITGDYGLAQVRLPTARFYRPGATVEDLYDPRTNLQIGFRFLRDLLDAYGDVRLALLAYNRGPTRLKQLLDEGRDPGNGYAQRIMEGYRDDR